MSTDKFNEILDYWDTLDNITPVNIEKDAQIITLPSNVLNWFVEKYNEKHSNNKKNKTDKTPAEGGATEPHSENTGDATSNLPWDTIISEVVNIPKNSTNDSGNSGGKNNISTSESNRIKAVEEILTTEQSYVKSLSQVVQLYIKPLTVNKLMSDDQRERIFSDMEIIVDLNTMFLERLEETFKMPAVNVGSVFRTNAPLFKLYYRYIRDFNAAHKELEKLTLEDEKLQDFLDKTAKKTDGKLNLTSFLIMPVQRLPRYEMLLSSVIKLTPPEHTDYQNLIISHEYIKEVNQYINERKKADEQTDAMVGILDIVNRKKKDIEDIKGYLLVKAIGGRNLPAMDKNGKSDPYLIISIGHQKFKTKIIKKTLNPTWNEEFVITVSADDLNSSATSTLYVNAFDWDEGLTDDEMGYIEFSLKELTEKEEQHGWYKLKPPAPSGKTEKDSSHHHDGIASPVPSAVLHAISIRNLERKKEKAEELRKMKGEIQLEFFYKEAAEFQNLQKIKNNAN